MSLTYSSLEFHFLLLSAFSIFLRNHQSTMESVLLCDSSDDADSDWEVLETGFDAPRTPSSTGDEAEPERPSYARASESGEDESESQTQTHSELVPRRKPGGYDSRVEQILYENPETPILITDAGKSLESGGKYIVYTIRTGVSRRICPPTPSTS